MTLSGLAEDKDTEEAELAPRADERDILQFKAVLRIARGLEEVRSPIGEVLTKLPRDLGNGARDDLRKAREGVALDDDDFGALALLVDKKSEFLKDMVWLAHRGKLDELQQDWRSSFRFESET